MTNNNNTKCDVSNGNDRPFTKGEKILVGIGAAAFALLGTTLKISDAYNKSIEKMDVSAAAVLRVKTAEALARNNIFFREP